MTFSHKALVAIGLLTFVTGVVLLFPARVAYHWFAPSTVQAGGLDGSIWSGSATEVTAAGLYLRDVRWRLKPMRLLTGKLGAR